ncbi:MAG TPA: pantoate--beta-alanine ligase [Acidimicrobiales bacterium]|nr:pantoate--beta-alanine ligase [Acidimicrobiales bacterium]
MSQSAGLQLEQLTSIAAFAAALDAHRAQGRSIGLVPTMGALHAGHAALVRRAAAECDVVAVTVFVNPLQFGPGEDLSRYPRTLAADAALAADCGATILFSPPVEEMYPGPVLTSVRVSGLTEALEGASRPGHFDGVATVVAKLLAMAGRCRAYFGEKDFQQLAVVRRLTTDLSFPVEIVGCPTVRESDGLALSSRNAYLSSEERAVAPLLHAALQEGAAAVAAGETDPAAVAALVARTLAAEPRFRLDYAAAVDPATLAVPAALAPGREVRILVAAHLGTTRLIDTLGTIGPAPSPAPDRKVDPACAGA